MPKPEKLYMSGHIIPSRGFEIQQVRIYLDATKPAPKRFEELEVVGEAVLIAIGVPRALVLNLDYSWGIGVEAWTGPTIGGYQSSWSSGYGSSYEMPIYMGKPRVNPVYTRPTPHRMNPTAAEFYPSTTADLANETQTGAFLSASQSPITPFSDQHPGDMYSNQNAGYIETSGYFGTQFDPTSLIASTQDNAGCIWDPYTQRWQYYNYNTQQWEFPGLFGYF
ncbi:hypothetical protein GGS24DRAFT_508097 [Hypoxylon argillaceum]|nr:hypothetical protein GGS24DRAFT_508097 [Hypoxylon argillaceum]